MTFLFIFVYLILIHIFTAFICYLSCFSCYYLFIFVLRVLLKSGIKIYFDVKKDSIVAKSYNIQYCSE